MTLQDLAQALARAGFAGVETVPPLVYARGDGPSAPEFTAELREGAVLLTQRHEVRAPDAALADWRLSSAGRLVLVGGETHLTLALPGDRLPAGLIEWRKLMQTATRAAITWRRSQRPLHGM